MEHLVTHLAEIARRKRALDFARSGLDMAIREAVKAGASKTDVAEAAGVSRPTLYKILARP